VAADEATAAARVVPVGHPTAPLSPTVPMALAVTGSVKLVT